MNSRSRTADVRLWSGFDDVVENMLPKIKSGSMIWIISPWITDVYSIYEFYKKINSVGKETVIINIATSGLLRDYYIGNFPPQSLEEIREYIKMPTEYDEHKKYIPKQLKCIEAFYILGAKIKLLAFLHAKVIAIYNPDQSELYISIGSANFTKAAKKGFYLFSEDRPIHFNGNIEATGTYCFVDPEEIKNTINSLNEIMSIKEPEVNYQVREEGRYRRNPGPFFSDYNTLKKVILGKEKTVQNLGKVQRAQRLATETSVAKFALSTFNDTKIVEFDLNPAIFAILKMTNTAFNVKNLENQMRRLFIGLTDFMNRNGLRVIGKSIHKDFVAVVETDSSVSDQFIGVTVLNAAWFEFTRITNTRKSNNTELDRSKLEKSFEELMDNLGFSHQHLSIHTHERESYFDTISTIDFINFIERNEMIKEGDDNVFAEFMKDTDSDIY